MVNTDAIRERMKEFACTHPDSAVRKNVKSNGAVNYYRQCLSCGENLEHLRQNDLSADVKASAQPLDRELRREWWIRQTTIWKMFYDAARKEEHDQFTKLREEYMRTPQWRSIRVKVFSRCDNWCEGCGDAPATEVHHLTYDRLGAEMLFDLVGVCRSCHERIHGIGG